MASDAAPTTGEQAEALADPDRCKLFGMALVWGTTFPGQSTNSRSVDLHSTREDHQSGAPGPGIRFARELGSPKPELTTWPRSIA